MIKGIRAGRESAFDQLFKEYYRSLSVFALRYIPDIEETKEIVQDLFVHLYENRKTIVISTSLESYLYQSVRNRCLNRIKQQQTQQKHKDQFQSEQQPSENLEDLIRQTELENQVFKVVNSLPPQCQRIFTMSRVKGLSNSEIAGQLSISKRTVETQISNALKILRAKLPNH